MMKRSRRFVKSHGNNNNYYTIIIIMMNFFFFALLLSESGYLNPQRQVVFHIHSR